MRGRKPDKFTLKAKDVPVLQALLRDGHTPQKVARRARILLDRAAGPRVNELAAKVDRDPTTIWRVCDRYRHGGLQAALYEAPRSGRPPVFSPSPANANRAPGLSRPA